jgi:hypothetical protein
MIVTGCGSSSSTVDGGQGGTTGAGGGTGGATDAGVDQGAPADATDVRADVGTEVSADVAADTGAGDTGNGDVSVSDTGAGDTAPHDTGSDVSGPCVTSFGAGNSLLYAFNGGANGGWTQFVTHDDANSGLTTSLGASFTDGHSCPGSLVLGVNFTAYGPPLLHGEAAATEHYYAASPGGQNWSAYKALHAWIKVQTADPLALAGVYPYVVSGPLGNYQGTSATSSDLADWHEVVIDLTRPAGGGAGVVATDVVKFGYEVVLNQTPPAGAPVNPSQVILFVDDIWLEAFPPADGGTGDGGAADTHATDAGSGQ